MLEEFDFTRVLGRWHPRNKEREISGNCTGKGASIPVVVSFQNKMLTRYPGIFTFRVLEEQIFPNYATKKYLDN